MSETKGAFVVLEGIDGSGTTTQATKLVERLRADGLAAATTREPSVGPVGVLLRQILSGRVVVPNGSGGSRAPRWDTMALLFAADRLDHVEAEIEPLLAKGQIVISDRYTGSSLAYQSVTSDDPASLAWIYDINRRARKPDLTIVLDVDPSVAATRRHARGGEAEIYERDAIQRALAAFYQDLERHLPHERVLHVDAGASVAEVHEKVYRATMSIVASAGATGSLAAEADEP